MTADQELERVVAWLRREAAMRFELAEEPDSKSAAIYNQTRAIAVEMAADALARHEHRETNDG